MRSDVQQLNGGVLGSQRGFIFLCCEVLVYSLSFLGLALKIYVVIGTKMVVITASIYISNCELKQCCNALHPGDITITLYCS